MHNRDCHLNNEFADLATGDEAFSRVRDGKVRRQILNSGDVAKLDRITTDHDEEDDDPGTG